MKRDQTELINFRVPKAVKLKLVEIARSEATTVTNILIKMICEQFKVKIEYSHSLRDEIEAIKDRIRTIEDKIQ